MTSNVAGAGEMLFDLQLVLNGRGKSQGLYPGPRVGQMAAAEGPWLCLRSSRPLGAPPRAHRDRAPGSEPPDTASECPGAGRRALLLGVGFPK